MNNMKRPLTKWEKGLFWGIAIYLMLCVGAWLIEVLPCKIEAAKTGNGIGMCGLITASVIFFALPIIPISALIGKSSDAQTSMSSPSLKGFASALIIWMIIFFISEKLYFYGNYPGFWKTLFLGQTEFRALPYYLVAGSLIGWLYGRMKKRS